MNELLSKKLAWRLAFAGLALLLSAGCSERQSVKFGVVLPLTGEVAHYGKSLEQGVQVAIQRIQADTTLPYDVEFEILDSESDPAKAASLAAQLFGDGALGIVGGVTSGEALAMAEVAKEEERVLVSPTASSDELSGAARSFFRIFPTAIQEASAMANFAIETLDVEDLVILVEEGLPFTESLATALEGVFAQSGGSVAEVIAFPGDATDYTDVVDRALAHEPSGIYLTVRGTHTASIVPMLRERGYGRTEGKPEWIMTTSAFAHPLPMSTAGTAADGMYLTMTVFDLEEPEGLMPEFVAAFRAANGGSDPDLYAGHGFDALVLLAEATRSTVNTLPNEFLKGMRAMDPLPGATGNLQFDESGNVQKFPRIHMIRGGKLLDFQRWREERMQEMREKLQEIQDESRSLRTQAVN